MESDTVAGSHQILRVLQKSDFTMMVKRFEWDKALPYHASRMEEIHWPKYFGMKKMGILGRRLTCRITHMEGKVEIRIHLWQLHHITKQNLDVRPKTR